MCVCVACLYCVPNEVVNAWEVRPGESVECAHFDLHLGA